MNILISTDNYLPKWDGVTRVLTEIIPRLPHNINIVAPYYGSVKKTLSGNKEPVTVTQIPISKICLGDYQPAKWKVKEIKKAVKKADIIFNQTLGPIGINAIRMAHKYKKPVVSFTHSLEWELFPKALNKRFAKRISHIIGKLLVKKMYKKCSLLICPSEHTAEELSRAGVKTPKRIVHLGIDTKKFFPGSQSHARKKLNLPQNAYIIGYHGRIAHEKNLITLLRAFNELDIPNKQLLIVGDGLLEIKKRLERDDVIITGMQDDVTPYLQSMNVYVLPSHTETTSLSVLEALSCGLIVISSKVGFINYYIEDGVNGFLFNKRHTHELRRKIEKVYHMDQKDKQTMQAKARASILEQFDWDLSAKGIDNLLTETMQKYTHNRR